MSEILLSVLIPTIFGRHRQASYLVGGLREQIGEKKSVEVLTLGDDRTMSVGRKRNILLSIAQGRYFAFVDDDDRVADDYIDRLLDAIGKTDADVIVFDQLCTHIKEGITEFCRYGIGMDYTRTPRAKAGEFDWTGLPAHTMCWRTETVNMVEFPEGNFGEDTSWVRGVCMMGRTEYRIEGWTGYYYDFNSERTATR